MCCVDRLRRLTNSGHWPEPALNGLAANDPKRPLVKIALRTAIGANFVWRSLDVLHRLPSHQPTSSACGSPIHVTKSSHMTANTIGPRKSPVMP